MRFSRISKLSQAFAIILLLISNWSGIYGQDVPEFMNRAGLYSTLGQMRNTSLSNPTIVRFMNSYNSQFGGRLTESFDPLKYDDAFGWSIGMFLYTLDVEAGFSKLGFKNQATFTDGRIRELEQDARQFFLNIGLTLPTDFVRIGPYLFMNSAKGQLYSRMIYPDGKVSYGVESVYNGIYDFNQLDVGYGFKASVGLKYFFLTAHAQRVGINLERIVGQEPRPPLAMQDELGIGGASSTHNNYDLPIYLSADTRNPTPGVILPTDPILVNPRLENWRFWFGITFSITGNLN